MVWFERADFLFCAMDSIVNHANKLASLSDGQHSPGIIYRVCVGNSKTPLFTGPTHCQNPSVAMVSLVDFPVRILPDASYVMPVYELALERARAGQCTMIFEEKDRYNEA